MKNLSVADTRTRNQLLRELSKTYPLAKAQLWKDNDQEEFVSFVKSGKFSEAVLVSTSALMQFKDELIQFVGELFKNSPDKAQEYQRLKRGWRLFAILLPLIRIYEGSDSTDQSLRSSASVKSLPTYPTSSDHIAPLQSSPELLSPVQFRRVIKLQDSFQSLRKILAPVFCTICKTTIPPWSFVEHSTVCYEFETGRRTLVNINKDLLKLCDEWNEEALKLTVAITQEKQMDLEREAFGQTRSEYFVSNYKRSLVSETSNKSNNVSPEKMHRNESSIGRVFRSDDNQEAFRDNNSDKGYQEKHSKSQAWPRKPNDSYFLRAVAHSNEMRLGQTRTTDVNSGNDSSSKGEAANSLFKTQSDQGSKANLPKSPFQEISQRFSAGATTQEHHPPTNDQEDDGEDFIGDAFFNDDNNSKGKENSFEQPAGDNDSEQEYDPDPDPGPSLMSGLGAGFFHTMGNRKFPTSPRKNTDTNINILGVIDEEDENLMSKRIINMNETPEHESPFRSSPSYFPPNENLKDELSKKSQRDSKSNSSFEKEKVEESAELKILGKGLDSSTRYIPGGSNVSEHANSNTFVAAKPNVRTSSGTASNRSRDSQSQEFSVPDSPNLVDPALARKRTAGNDPVSELAKEALQNPLIHQKHSSEIRIRKEPLSPIKRDPQTNSFKKSFKGFQNNSQIEASANPGYFQPKMSGEFSMSKLETSSQNPEPDSPMLPTKKQDPPRKSKFQAQTFYAKSNLGNNLMDFWKADSSKSISKMASKDQTGGGSLKDEPKTSAASMNRYDPNYPSAPTQFSKKGNFFASMNSQTQIWGKNYLQTISQEDRPGSSVLLDNVESNKIRLPRFPTCQTEYKPRRQVKEPKPLMEKPIVPMTRKDIWIQASKSVTEYQKPKPRTPQEEKPTEDHWVYILNKRIQQYKSTLWASGIAVNYKVEKDLIFDLGLIKIKFQKREHTKFVNRFIESLRQRIELVEQQCKRQTTIKNLEENFRVRRLYRNKISVSFTNIRNVDANQVKRSKALTALNLDSHKGKSITKLPVKETTPFSFMDKLMQQEKAKLDQEKKRKLSVDHDTSKKKDTSKQESKSDLNSPQSKRNQQETSLDRDLSMSSLSFGEDESSPQEAQGHPDPKKSQKFPTSTAVDFKIVKIEPKKEEAPAAIKIHPKMKKHPSDSKIVLTAEREKFFYEQTAEETLESFEFLKEIGKGAYGKVYLAMHKVSKEIYALKVIQFQEKVTKKVLEELRNEISILNIIEGEFLAKAFFSFVDRNCLCIAMEFMLGGDFRCVLENEGRLDQTAARWYIAQLCTAVEELHSHNIVHRDLKPENLLLDKNSKLKLADFGLSEFRKRVDKTGKLDDKNIDIRLKNPTAKGAKEKYIVGTPDYIPPEILYEAESTNERKLGDTEGSARNAIDTPSKKEMLEKSQEPLSLEQSESWRNPSPDLHSSQIQSQRLMDPSNLKHLDGKSAAIDWWGVGCLLYEFLVGVSPFGGMSLAEVFDNIKKGNIIWPEIGYEEDQISPEAHDLILRFLDRDPLKRIGVSSFQEIRDHPFFRELDWETLPTGKPPLSFDFKTPALSKQIKVSMVVPRKPVSMPTYNFDHQDLVISRLDLFYELNIKRIMEFR